METRQQARYENTEQSGWQTALHRKQTANCNGPAQDAGAGAKGSNGAGTLTLQLVDGKFRDSRWQEGRWVLDSFKDATGSMDWDKVRSSCALY